MIYMKSLGLSTVISQDLEFVMNLAERMAHLRYYDEQFRRMIEKGEAKWSFTHLKIYLRSVLDSMRDNAATTTAELLPSVSKMNPLKEACFNHQSGLHCSAGLACTFQHNCSNIWKLIPSPNANCPFKNRSNCCQKIPPNRQDLTTCRPSVMATNLLSPKDQKQTLCNTTSKGKGSCKINICIPFSVGKNPNISSQSDNEFRQFPT
ncbi:hypothetical protein CHS0354_027114 [Potamilus streckersoni]|uniref:Uncharacterized protein n=1 Tax=Potamilus streckersoni TaxID=2493646 RepID=A0AAE0VM45_9BIVA|nr:hypothetical protein CHS0354_027114 [Potamilus streckersoni]